MTILLGATSLLFILLLAGMPIGFAIGASGAIGLFLTGGWDAMNSVLSTSPYTAVASFSLGAIPMFIFMGEMVSHGGVTDELFETTSAWTGRLPGGLGIATVISGAAFGAISGSSTAGAATLAPTTIPQLVKNGYSRKLANGLVATVGTLAMMIPPSIALILYGLLAEKSIGKLLIAGIIPGLILSVALCLTLLLIIRRDGSLVTKGHKYSFAEKLKALSTTWSYFILFLIVFGTIYLGAATPTEAAAIGAFGTVVLNGLRKRLSRKILVAALTETASITAMISMMLVGAYIFGYFLVLNGVTQDLTQFITGLGWNRYLILILFGVLYLVLGAFMDQVAILTLTVPLVVPIITGLGFDPIWFGVMVILFAEIGMITPPFGMNVFVVARCTNQPAASVFAGVWPFVGALLVVAVILSAFPSIVLWLPHFM
ncbi:MAG TPA: TRAP transporter large permease [Castellaniella sp.]|uniref:TRAP transporter large permease n=1 Tax=Castellaniella sp. TaxID=1955812 RepID=UPI002F0CA59C